MNDDPFDLARFVQAQSGSYPAALGEIRAGAKRSHWMWYVFPQIEGLGSSFMAQKYAVSGADEARAYLAHPVLGPRLVECFEAALALEARSARAVFGSVDEMKFRSCATLFAAVGPPGSVFEKVLDEYFAGERCALTLLRLGAQ